MRHRPRGADFLDLQGDGIGFVHSDPDGQDSVAAGIFENDNGSIGYGIEHQASDFHFYFHCDSLQIKTKNHSTTKDTKLHEGKHLTHDAISPARLFGKIVVTRTGT